MTLSKDEREACLAEMERLRPRTSTDGSHPMRFPTPEESAAGWRSNDLALLDAVLPLIERAVRRSVIEEAAGVANDPDAIEFARDMGGPLALIELSTRREIAEAILALADEVRG